MKSDVRVGLHLGGGGANEYAHNGAVLAESMPHILTYTMKNPKTVTGRQKK